ncbi:hypothetical protein D187_003901 [Cystobacter fuscus DSM 2262]|uniref:Uncharacterized protein n=2 Tax=Cystobacter fuscus TaxID=43 RepID=S9QAR8_CYSF2|nr:hypothetical protein D187_003901 [Cystobacter fuscus DSM 2262]
MGGMRLRSLPPLAAWGSFVVTTIASACPDCPTSRVVRRAIVEVGFVDALVMVCVPFLLIGFLSALLYRVGLTGRQGEDHGG